MVIAIDGYEANVNNRVGIGRYAYEILQHISKIPSKHSFNIYLPDSPQPDMPKTSQMWNYKVTGPKSLWTFVGLPLALIIDPPDVIFSPTHYVPRWVSTPRVMAIMDVSYLVYPQMFRPTDLHQLINWTAHSVRVARAILTISDFSKRAIIKAYGVPSERVIVTYPGLTMPKVQMKPNDLGDYILSVGTLQPRKNFVRLIEAFSQIASKYRKLTVVIVGKRGWMYEEILASPKKYGVEDKVKFLDFVSDEELPVLYKGAKVFALPSLYEGFGLPVLEAMSYGCPVVVSKTSSLPEIAGEAGIYVDPEDVDNIAKGLVDALEGKSAEKRARAAKTQVAKFTWEKAGKQTLGVLEKVGRGEL